MSKKPYPFSVCEQCCNGDVSQEQIQEAVNNYLEENPITQTEEVYTVVVEQNASGNYSLVQGKYSDIKNAYNNKKVIVMYDITLGHCAMLWQISDTFAAFCCNTAAENHMYDIQIDDTVTTLKTEMYTKPQVDILIGDIDSALDELHNYAQALIGGTSE